MSTEQPDRLTETVYTIIVKKHFIFPYKPDGLSSLAGSSEQAFNVQVYFPFFSFVTIDPHRTSLTLRFEKLR